MTVTAQSFVAVYSEFANPVTYPTEAVQFWISQAAITLNLCVFGASADLATMLYVAHNLVLSARNAREAQRGGIVGQATGPVSAKSVGPVSVSYNTGLVAIEGAGIWNGTSYGQQLYKMMQTFGTGPVYAPRPTRVYDIAGLRNR